MNTKQNFIEFLKKSNGHSRLPPLKINIQVLIQAFANENIAPHELAAVLYHYPVISARLLGLANSAWARPASPITHLEAACVRLGQATVKGVSLALAVASSFDASRCPSFDPIRFWTTSMLVAEGGALLAANLTDKDCYAAELKLTVQTAGILHNLGLLWLADNLALEIEDVLKLTLSEPLLSVNQAIADGVGIDYCQVGAWLFAQWGLPEELIAAVAGHRESQHQDSASVPALLVGAAASMVSAVCHERNELPENTRLHRLGIDLVHQDRVFTQLAKQRDSTRELAKTLFV
jgi:HD-like signal output (HDOD) protein